LVRDRSVAEGASMACVFRFVGIGKFDASGGAEQRRKIDLFGLFRIASVVRNENVLRVFFAVFDDRICHAKHR
jgi:hypothetical protein